MVRNPNPGASVSIPLAITIQNSGTALSYAAAKRFLEHATWGPTPDSIAHLQAIGINAWLTEQFSEPVSTYNLPVDTSSNLSTLQEQFFQECCCRTRSVTPAPGICAGSNRGRFRGEADDL